jgi:transcriptional regulator with XRE-family HTH domain
MNAWEKWVKLHRENPPYMPYQTKQLAEHLGVTRRLIEFWMIGKGKPSDKHMERIAEYLKEAEKLLDSNGKLSDENNQKKY